MRRRNGFFGPDQTGGCPCGSRRPTQACHRRTDGSWRAEPWTPSASPSTGHRNPRCYAGRLHDCSPRLSSEHFFARAGQRPLLSNLSFPSEPHSLLPGPEGIRPVLCERHQHALTPLDQEAARAYRALRRFDAPPGQRPLLLADDIELLSGPLLEAWLLKTHFGLLAAQNPTANQPPTTWRAGAEPVLVDVLFRGEPWPTGWGLWNTPPGAPTAAAADPRAGPFHCNGRTWGPVAELGPLPLQLLLGPPSMPDAVHQPGGLVLMHEHSFLRKVLAFGWPDGAGGPPIVIKRLGPANDLISRSWRPPVHPS